MALILDYNYNTNTHIMGVFLIFKKKFQILTSNKKQMIKYLYLLNRLFYARLYKYYKQKTKENIYFLP